MSVSFRILIYLIKVISALLTREFPSELPLRSPSEGPFHSM